MKSSTYYVHMKTKILADFQICISESLTKREFVFDFCSIIISINLRKLLIISEINVRKYDKEQFVWQPIFNSFLLLQMLTFSRRSFEKKIIVTLKYLPWPVALRGML